MDASAYKEQYRADMIVWGERKRNEDPGFFADIVVCCGVGWVVE